MMYTIEILVRLIIIFLVFFIIPIILIWEYKENKKLEITEINEYYNISGGYCWLCLLKQQIKTRKSKIYRARIERAKSIMQTNRRKKINTFLDTSYKSKTS